MGKGYKKAVQRKKKHHTNGKYKWKHVRLSPWLKKCKSKRRYNFYLVVGNNKDVWSYLMLSRVWENKYFTYY